MNKNRIGGGHRGWEGQYLQSPILARKRWS